MNNLNTLSIKELMREAVRDMRAGKHEIAVDITTEIIEREPEHAGAHAIQFSALFKAQRFEQARRMGTVAAKLNPKSVFVLNNQACLQLEAKQPAAAAGLLKSLIDQYGERGQWLYNLALAQRMVGNFDYAIQTFARTLDFEETHDRAAFQLADCHTLAGNHEQAIRAFDYVRLLRGKHAPSHSNYLHHAVNNGQITEADLKLELALWQDRFTPAENRYETSPIKDLNAIRIGFLIGKLPRDWLKMMVVPLINGLANGLTNGLPKRSDSVTVYWHDERFDPNLFAPNIEIVQSAGLTDADFAREIRAGAIDVMIDVCGMRIGCRQRVLGLQVAAKQYGWLAHEGHYSSNRITVLDLPYAFEHKDKHIDGGPVPDKTFAALGCHRGLSNQVLTNWASLLNELPDWKLLIPCQDKLINRHLKRRFDNLNIDESRLIFDDTIQLTENTIALDNFVENDPVATMIALKQGATVVAMKGELYPAQHTARLFAQCGLSDQLTASPANYKHHALDLAKSIETGAFIPWRINSGQFDDMENFINATRKAIVE